ncbi:hypothetical protein AAY473_023859 [Plecturocebus cupreus]
MPIIPALWEAKAGGSPEVTCCQEDNNNFPMTTLEQDPWHCKQGTLVLSSPSEVIRADQVAAFQCEASIWVQGCYRHCFSQQDGREEDKTHFYTWIWKGKALSVIVDH